MEDYRKLLAISSLMIVLLLSPPIPGASSQFKATSASSDTGSGVYAVITRPDSSTWDQSTLSLLTSKGMNEIYDFPTGSCECVFAIDSSGNYIVAEVYGNALTKVTPGGVRTVIYKFPDGTKPADVKIDSSGDYIVTEMNTSKLSKITPGGVRMEIANITAPNAVAIDSFGNYIVTQTIWPSLNVLAKVTPDGNVSTIYNLPYRSWPGWVEIDSSGNYIVTTHDGNALWRVTPDGAATKIFSFDYGTYPYSAVIDSNGNYIVSEYEAQVLSQITPAGVRTELYHFSDWPSEVRVISTGDLTPIPEYPGGMVMILTALAVSTALLFTRMKKPAG
ncbi:MAG TPA: hypothetical protein VMS77_04315 [Conexivisphaerales archaeon]|nr:hypothetical protein [Conexivisphaerales archaeon]